ncbi:hypothetical protein JW859_07595 [bacterium]|nr:hypothetical protein [bacterium]
MNLTRLADLIVRDLLIIGVAGAPLAWLWRGETGGWSFLAGSIWLALNFTLLAWLLAGFSSGKRPSCLFIIALACAKIPASYFLLFWMYKVDYLDDWCLTAGMLVLPLVLVYQGLASRPQRQVTEEG